MKSLLIDTSTNNIGIGVFDGKNAFTKATQMVKKV